MKINRLLTAALITLATVLTGCVKESVWDRATGIDNSKAAPEGFTYDDAMSSKTSLAVYWDGQKAVAAGAQSFMVQLTDKNNMDKGNSWDSKLTQVLTIDKENYESAIFSGLTEGSCYYIRVRANYPGSVYSPWAYLSKEDGTPALYQVGFGEVPTVPVLTFVPLIRDIKVSWTYCEGATKYILEYRKVGAANWTSVETTATNYKVSGLTASTQYEFRATSVTATENHTSEVYKVTTREPISFPVTINNVDEYLSFFDSEDIVLAEATDEVKIAADLDFTGVDYPVVGEFGGILNGNNKTLKNIKSASPLFQSVNVVKDLTIDASCEFKTTSDETFAALADSLITGGSLNKVVNNAKVIGTYSDLESPYVFAGLVAYAFGDIENCANNGEVKFTAETVNSGAMGGIVAHTFGAVNNTNNTGAVTAEIGVVGKKQRIYKTNKYTKAPSIGGIVGLAYGNFEMNNCENRGKLTYKVADITLTANYNRTQIGGIVGAPSGVVTECKNYGEINVIHTLPTRGQYTGYEHTLCIGGIGGGDYDAEARFGGKEEETSSYINCVNEGNINVDSDAAKANSTIGGIVGWPNAENGTVTNETNGCTNKGNIKVKGNGKFRMGGIQGGTGIIRNCRNEGNVTLESGAPDVCCVGSVAGFHSQNHAIANTYAGGNISASIPVMGIGGLIGNNGDATNTSGEGCVINCNITGGTEANAGFIVGYWNGTGKNVTLGSAESPIEVSGTINGAAPSAANVCGTAKASGAHVLNYVIK